MVINPVSLKGDIYCPHCQTQHSTEAWEYRTRVACNILNIDEEDISLMSESWEDHEFTCPRCSNEFFLFDIKRFQQVVIEGKANIKHMLHEIEFDTEHAQAFQLINGEDVEVTYKNGQFIIEATLDGEKFVTKHNTVEEAFTHLLTYDLDFTKYQD